MIALGKVSVETKATGVQLLVEEETGQFYI